MIPAEKYTDDQPDAVTTPSDVRNVKPEAPVEPVVAIEVAPPRPFPIASAIALIIGTPLLALCIATTVEFLSDYAGDYAAAYGWSVVLASAALGAVATLAAVKIRGMRG